MSDVVGPTVVAGIFIGWFLYFFLWLFIDRIDWLKFKKYFLICNDKRKEEISSSLNIIEKEFENLAGSTNTLLFRRKANAFSDFLNYLRKYWLN